MTNSLRTLSLMLMVISFGAAAAFCAPIPQGNQGTPPPNHPAQAQVAQQEPLPADARKPDLTLRVGHTQSVQALAFSPDGKWLASGGYDKSIIVWNLSSGREEFHLGGLPVRQAPLEARSQSLNKQAISGLAFNPEIGRAHV